MAKARAYSSSLRRDQSGIAQEYRQDIVGIFVAGLVAVKKSPLEDSSWWVAFRGMEYVYVFFGARKRV